MSIRRYLPSTQFAVMVASLTAAGGLIAAAQWYTNRNSAPPELGSATPASNTQDPSLQGGAEADWQQKLKEIQAQSGVSLPPPPSPEGVSALLLQAESSNLTDSVGRSLLVKLTAAGMQGLGDDAPPQDQIISQAAAQIQTERSSPSPSLTITETTPATLRAYGNAVMAVLGKHPRANSGDTLLAVAKAVDARDSTPLSALAPIGREYRALADDLSAIPVPSTLSPLYAHVVQNLYTIADTYPNMQKTIDDPLRGLSALQAYQSLMDETGRVFTN